MKKLLYFIVAVVIIIGVTLGIDLFYPAPMPDIRAAVARNPSGEELVERGHYLVHAADCVSCHTVTGEAPFSGGRAFQMPIGTIWSPNITPDKQTGIGTWTDAEFVRAVRYGVGKNGENLYPVFSYASYHLMTDEDALAIKAYLFSLEPVVKEAKAPDISLPFSPRPFVRIWNKINIPDGPLTHDDTQSEAWNRGRYLVEALGHCGECHTPRNMTMGLDRRHAFAGSHIDGWVAYNISSDPKEGIGSWSKEKLVTYLKSGHAENAGTAGGPMRESVDTGLKYLSDADIDAMATYLQSVPAQKTSDPIVAARGQLMEKSATYMPISGDHGLNQRGLHLYQQACASCHGWNGSGIETSRAALAGIRSVNDPKATNLIQKVLYGTADGTGKNGAMPAYASWTNEEIADLANYVVGHFGGVTTNIMPADVANLRKQK